MSVDKLIAGIPKRSEPERKVMRKRALAAMQSGSAAVAADASHLFVTLEAFPTDQLSAREQLVKSLAAEPRTKRVVGAFQTVEPSPTEARLIRVLLNNPDSTCAELSTRIGWAPNIWDMAFGALYQKRSHFLRALAGTPSEDASSFLPLLTLPSRGPDGVIRYTMKPEAAEAFRQLGYGSNQRSGAALN